MSLYSNVEFASQQGFSMRMMSLLGMASCRDRESGTAELGTCRHTQH
jgi:hypothetical protein